MIKHVFGRKLKRDVHERNALFKSLLSELVMHERIQSTEEKIKSIKADADKLITKAKYKDQLHARMLLQPAVSAEAVNKLILELAPRFTNRQGGYTRVLKMNRRFNDNARMAMIEWTEKSNENIKMKNEKIDKHQKEIKATEKTAPKSLNAPTEKTPAKTRKSTVKKEKAK